MGGVDSVVQTIGSERGPLVLLDGFARDPDGLRAAARAATFEPGRPFYPGIRAPLPPAYLDDQLPVIADAIARTFGLTGPVTVIDASFAIVTTPPAALSVQQRLPHCDATAATRIALIHYLSDDPGGTAFYRHRSTGFETVSDSRKPVYDGQIEAELRINGPPPAAYIDGDTALFERILRVDARDNRALIYRSNQLHSGAITPDAALSADPATGRLTITAFLSVG